MCLDYLWDKEKTKEWLKNKPETITAYKVVYEGIYNEIRPPFQDGVYQKINKIVGRRSRKSTEGGRYSPHYHLCLTKKGAGSWANGWRQRIILKCKIPKKAITAVGKQRGLITIVTKEFTFVEGDEHFKGKNNVHK